MLAIVNCTGTPGASRRDTGAEATLLHLARQGWPLWHMGVSESRGLLESCSTVLAYVRTPKHGTNPPCAGQRESDGNARQMREKCPHSSPPSTLRRRATCAKAFSGAGHYRLRSQPMQRDRKLFLVGQNAEAWGQSPAATEAGPRNWEDAAKIPVPWAARR